MPRRYFEDGVEIVIEDLQAISSAAERSLYDRLVYEMVQRKENAFFGDSFIVSYSSANSVIVKKGSGFQTDSTQVTPEPTRRLLYLDVNQTVTLDAPNSVNNRIDIICVKNRLSTELTASRNFKDAITSVISTQTLITQKDWNAEILTVVGTPGVSPAVPATPAGYIKICELLVTAVSGLSGSGAVTDSRTLMPIGGTVTVDTTGKVRITAGATTTISQIVTDIDALLKNGYFEYYDMDDLGADPTAPAASKKRIYFKSGLPYYRSNGGAITPLGSGGGGGGGGANWQPVAAAGPVEDYEYDEKVWKFEQSASQSLTLWVHVPTGYIAGRQLVLKAGFYSPTASNVWRFQAVTTLLRKNNDAVDSTTNQNTSNSGDITNTVAKRLREISIDLTSSVGTINSVAVSAGDVIKLQLTRVIPGAGTEDTADIRFIPSSTEVLQL